MKKICIEEDITILVGMNESGRISGLEAIAKSNYFQKVEALKFNRTHDYSRKEKRNWTRVGIDPFATTAEYAIVDFLLEIIGNDIGKKIIWASMTTV